MKKKENLLEEIKTLQELLESKDVVIKESINIMKALVFKFGGKVLLKPEFLQAAKSKDNYVDIKYDEIGRLKLEVKEISELDK